MLYLAAAYRPYNSKLQTKRYMLATQFKPTHAREVAPGQTESRTSFVPLAALVTLIAIVLFLIAR